MSKLPYTQSGFTAVELLVTLFVAAAFLVSGYQLFNVVIQSGGQTRSSSKADNTAYSYLRKYSDSAINPCTPSTPLATTPVTISGLANPTIGVVITCPVATATSLSKVEATLTYGTSPDNTTIKRSIYIKK